MLRVVLKIGLMVWVVLLLSLLVVEGLGRHQGPPTWVALVIERNNRDEKRLVQVWPGVAHADPLMRQYWPNFAYYGLNATATAAYFASIPPSPARMAFYAVDPSARVQSILTNVENGQVLFSPNRQWLAYNPHSEDATQDIWLTNLTKAKQVHISAYLPRHFAFFGHAFSPNGQWYAVMGKDLKTNRFHVWSFHLSSPRWMAVASWQSNQRVSFLEAASNDSVIFQIDARFYRVPFNGGSPALLIGDNWQPASASDHEYIIGIYPQLDAVVVGRTNDAAMTVVGVRASTGQGLWVSHDIITRINSNLGLPLSNTDNHALMLINTIPGRLNVMTGEYQLMPDWIGGRNIPLFTPSPDGLSLFYFRYDLMTQDGTWWRFDWPTQQSRQITTQRMKSYAVAGASPDGQWALLTNGTSPVHLNWLHLRTGQVEPVVNRADYQLVDWMHPVVRSWRPIPLILIAGGLWFVSFAPRNRIPRLKNQMSA